MKYFSIFSSSKKLLVLVVLLAFANLIVWGQRMVVDFSNKNLYSSGVAFSVDGAPLHFTNRLIFKKTSFISSIKYNWGAKTSAMQQSGNVAQGMLGEWKFTFNDSVKSGPSVFDDLEFKDDFTFNRLYMESGRARLRLLPIAENLGGQCFYFIRMALVYCGSSTVGEGL